MDKEFFEFLEEEYGIWDFVDYIIDWQKVQEWDFPGMIKRDIPRDTLKPYLKTAKVYRGMYVSPQDVLSSGACSWSLDYSIARDFAVSNQYQKDIYCRSDSPTEPIIFTKEEEIIDLSLMIEDVKEWLKEHEDEVDDIYQSEIEEFLEGFYEENEVFSDFNIESVYIKSTNADIEKEIPFKEYLKKYNNLYELVRCDLDNEKSFSEIVETYSKDYEVQTVANIIMWNMDKLRK